MPPPKPSGNRPQGGVQQTSVIGPRTRVWNAAVCDEWMPRLQLPLTSEQFRQLPRHPSYRYDFLDGVAWLNPRPRYHHARLDLLEHNLERSDSVVLRPVQPEDWEPLTDLFSLAFARHQPFFGVEPDLRRTAAEGALTQTRVGGDGPWIEAASFVAASHEPGAPTGLVGAALVTLLPPLDPTIDQEIEDTFHWRETPTEGCVERCEGRPHLTWVFVDPREVGRGIGTTLLAGVAEALLELGYDELISTFLRGNDSSILWHWRTGFKLLSYPRPLRRQSTD